MKAVCVLTRSNCRLVINPSQCLQRWRYSGLQSLDPSAKVVSFSGIDAALQFRRRLSGGAGLMPNRHITPIKDVVHGYIPLSPLEKTVIDSRHFQRLHFILQNSSTYTAYPNNKNSRFAHSLGVAHVAGEIFRHSVNNSRQGALRRGIRSMAESVAKYLATTERSRKTLEESWRKSVGYQFAFQHRPIDGSRSVGNFTDTENGIFIEEYDPLFLLNTFGVAVRICGLIHDIGHLPMSHIFENALKQAPTIFERYGDDEKFKIAFSNNYDDLDKDIFSPTRGYGYTKHRYTAICNSLGIKLNDFQIFLRKLPVHERRGIQIFDEICLDVENGRDPDRAYMLTVFHIANTIMFSKRNNGVSESNNIFPCLRDIISSQLDADRIDYTLRDPIESGVTDRTFDSRRLVSQFVLHYSSSKRKFSICPSYKSLSVVESFFHSRFLNYRFIVYHHSVVRMNLLVEEIIKQLLRLCYIDPSSDVVFLLKSYGFIEIRDDSDVSKNQILPNYSNRIVDESWLRSMLLDISDIIKKTNSIELNHLRMLIETFIFRQTRNLYTMWKSEIDYRTAAEKHGDVDGENPFIVSAEERILIEEALNRFASEHVRDILIFRQFLEPKVYHTDEEVLHVVDERGELWNVSDVSPYLASLESISRRSPNLHVSFFAKNIKSTRKYLKLCDMIERDLILAVRERRERERRKRTKRRRRERLNAIEGERHV